MSKKINDLINFADSGAKVERYPTETDRLVQGMPEQNNTLHFAVDEKFFAGEWGAGKSAIRRMNISTS